MLPDHRRPLRHLHAGGAQRPRPDHIRCDEQFPAVELQPVDLVQEGRAEVCSVVGGAACRMAYRECTIVGRVVFEEDERGDVEGQFGLGVAVGLFDLCDVAVETEVLRDVEFGDVCVLLGGDCWAG